MPTLLNGRGTPTGNSTPLKLRLLTYNTFSCDPSHTASQTRALLAVLETARADVIALQEVSQPFYRALQRWAAAVAAKEEEGGGGWTMTSLQQVWDVQGLEGEAPSGPTRKRGLKEACVVLVREALLLGDYGGGGSNGGEVRIAKLDKSTDEVGKAAIGFRLIRNGHEVVSLPSLLAFALKTDEHYSHELDGIRRTAPPRDFPFLGPPGERCAPLPAVPILSLVPLVFNPPQPFRQQWQL